MRSNDQIMKDIDKGKGLKPIPTQSSNQTSGITQEQRGQDSGFRMDRFTRQDSSNGNNSKNEE